MRFSTFLIVAVGFLVSHAITEPRANIASAPRRKKKGTRAASKIPSSYSSRQRREAADIIDVSTDKRRPRKQSESRRQRDIDSEGDEVPEMRATREAASSAASERKKASDIVFDVSPDLEIAQQQANPLEWFFEGLLPDEPTKYQDPYSDEYLNVGECTGLETNLFLTEVYTAVVQAEGLALKRSAE